jgi:hypothetical protein
VNFLRNYALLICAAAKSFFKEKKNWNNPSIQGDTLQIVVQNDLDVDVSIHWHGIWQTGTPWVRVRDLCKLFFFFFGKPNNKILNKHFFTNQMDGVTG